MKKINVLLLGALITMGSTSIFAQKRNLTLNEILDTRSDIITKSIPSIPFWADDKHYVENKFSRGQGGNSSVVDVKTGEKKPYVSSISPNIVQDRSGQLLFRNSGKLTIISGDSMSRQNPTMSPDSNWVAFTSKNNLYAVEIATGRQIQLTSDGSDVILNGVASWVYYEEILDHAKSAFWWSPDSKRIVFFSSDQSKIPIYTIFNPDGIHGTWTKDYYPLPGDPNPEVKIGIATLENGSIQWADFDYKADQYFGKPFWSSDNNLWIQWMPREQNQLKIYSVNISSGSKTEVYNEEQPTWVDWKDNLYFLSKQQGYIVQSDKDGWDQLYWYDMNGKLKRQITFDKFWNTKVLKIDESKKTIYFTSAKEISTRTDFYSIKFDGSALKRLTFGNYNHTVSLSPGANYFITNYSNIKTPERQALVDVATGKIIRELADGKGDNFDQLELSTKEIIWFTTNDGFKVPALVMIPPNLDQTIKHPVMLRTYGGPNRPMVIDRWWGGMSIYLYEGAITVILDNRASGHCGKAGLNSIHRCLGKNELDDYIQFVTSYLYKKSYVDRTKIAIEGQSYGGYLTALAMTKGAEYFQYGIADYGVMDWKLYDSHYTERYMDTPESNPEGYKETSVLNYVDNYNKESNDGVLFVRHGLADNNVHIQNSMQLINLLQNKNKNFEMKFYPGCAHGYIGPKLSSANNDAMRFYFRHLFNKEVPKGALK